MEIGFSNVNRVNLPPMTGAAGAAPAAEPARDGWTAREAGTAELAKVSGEGAVDEAALRRDDELGTLMSKAFDPASAAAALPPLGDLSVAAAQAHMS